MDRQAINDLLRRGKGWRVLISALTIVSVTCSWAFCSGWPSGRSRGEARLDEPFSHVAQRAAPIRAEQAVHGDGRFQGPAPGESGAFVSLDPDRPREGSPPMLSDRPSSRRRLDPLDVVSLRAH